ADQVTAYGYDALGHVTSVSLPGGMSSTITYDSFGLKKSINDSQVGVTNYTYYNNGTLRTTTTGDPALTSYKTVAFTYDQLNRVIKKSATDSQSGPEDPITYSYDEAGHTDAIGRLTTITGNNGITTQYAYTPLGQRSVVYREIANSWTGTSDK